MSSADVRRVLMLLCLVGIFVFYYLWKVSYPPTDKNIVPRALYKVRAYTTSKEEVMKIKKVAKDIGVKGSVYKDVRKVKKFLGYVVYQDFSTKEGIEKIEYIRDFLEANGYVPRIEEDKKKSCVRVQVGRIYSTKDKALHVAKKIKERSLVPFKVEKFFKDTPYKAFVVVFSNIRHRDVAIKLKKELSKITSDVEMISY